VVEAQLRENFEIGHPTPAYHALLQAVPVEFVGAPARLRALVEVLSAGVAATFSAQVAVWTQSHWCHMVPPVLS